MEKRVGFGPRFGALLIDAVLVAVLSLVLGSTIGALLGVSGAASAAGAVGAESADAALAAAAGGFMGMIAGMLIGMIIIGTGYFLVEGFTGWTLGKLMLGLRVGGADGSKASIGTLLKRVGIKQVSMILGFVSLLTGVAIIHTIGQIGGLVIFLGGFMIFSATKQTLHDKLATTAVFKKADIQG